MYKINSQNARSIKQSAYVFVALVGNKVMLNLFISASESMNYTGQVVRKLYHIWP